MREKSPERREGDPDLRALLEATRERGHCGGRLLAASLSLSVVIHIFAMICLPSALTTVKVLRVALLVDSGDVAVEVERSDAMSASPTSAFRPAPPPEIREKYAPLPEVDSAPPRRHFGNIPAGFPSPADLPQATPTRQIETRQPAPLKSRRNGFGRTDQPLPPETADLSPIFRESVTRPTIPQTPDEILPRREERFVLAEAGVPSFKPTFPPARRERESASETLPERINAEPVLTERIPARRERKIETYASDSHGRSRDGFGRTDKPIPLETAGLSPTFLESVSFSASARMPAKILSLHEERFLPAEVDVLYVGPDLPPPIGLEEFTLEPPLTPTSALPIRMRRHENVPTGRVEAPVRRIVPEREAPNPKTREIPESWISQPSPASPSLAGGDQREYGMEERPNSVSGFVIPYPDISRRRGESGMVLVRAVIDAQGHCLSAAIARSSGYRNLDRAAVEGVKKATYRPARKGGIAVKAEEDFHVEFRLQ
jgi:TonB family protein